MPAPLGQPVRPPMVKEGKDARLLAAEALAGLRQANRRITDGKRFYDDVRGRLW